MPAKLSIEDALLLLQQGARPVAGGTDFYPALNERIAPENCIDIASIEGLDSIGFENGYWRIGAAVSWSDLLAFNFPPAFTGLQQAAREIGSIQIQNNATLVGNICNASPAADGVPCLLALNAKVQMCSTEKELTVELSEFITGVRETLLESTGMVTQLLIPAVNSQDSSNVQSVFVKLGSRSYLVISIVMLSIVVECDDHGVILDIRIAVGACSAVAQRLTQLENELVGKTLNQHNIQTLVVAKHLSELSPIDDVRATASYRLNATLVLLKRALLTLADN